MTARKLRCHTRFVLAAAAVFVWGAWAIPLAAQETIQPPTEEDPQPPPRVFNIDPNTPEKDLLPIAPRTTASSFQTKDLARIPEIHFQDVVLQAKLPPLAKDREVATGLTGATREDVKKAWQMYGDTLSEEEVLAKAAEAAGKREKTQQQIARQLEAIRFLNQKKSDRFVELLLETRPDLAGLPFVMGDACRLKKEEGHKFTAAVAMVQTSLKDSSSEPKAFWRTFNASRDLSTRGFSSTSPASSVKNRADGKACVAALMQILPKESAAVRLGLVEQLTTFDASKADCDAASHALARLSIFSPEGQIRKAANNVLLKRATPPATEVLLHGLRYPWAAIAENSADALVQQQRTDLIPQLINMLEEADPRAPVVQEVNGKKVLAVRELVRINHMRNCMLCHPPMSTAVDTSNVRVSKRSVQVTTVVSGPVPAPGHDLQTDPENGGYGSFQNPDVLIRADVTYLRQDFSLMQKVENPEPWPEMQRFDFLVRTRVVSEQEADAIRTELGRQPSPYRQAARNALRRLTGRDAGDTAEAWRNALARN